MSASPASAPPRSRLFWRVFAGNAVVLTAAAVGLAASPATVSFPIGPVQALVLALGLAALLAVNFVVMRRAFAPFDKLVGFVRSVDPQLPGARLELPDAGPDVHRIAIALNEMLARLESEREQSARQLVAAQEDERRRVSRELHDEVGQLITAALLGVDHAGLPSQAPTEDRLAPVRLTLEQALDSVRGIARRLRPGTLDDLGLSDSLLALGASFGGDGQSPVQAVLEPGALNGLDDEAELAVYRIAQEACTNAVRHAPGSHVVIRVSRQDRQLTMSVSDDGPGISSAERRGVGLAGMRERAALIGADLAVTRRTTGGTEVRLTLPA